MPELSTTTLIGYTSAAILLTTIIEVIRRMVEGREDVARFAFGGQLLAAIGFALRGVLADDVLFTVLSASVGMFALAGLVLASVSRHIWHTRTPSISPQHSRHVRSFFVRVRAGETLESAKDLSRVLETIRRVEA